MDVPHSVSLGFPLLCVSFVELRNSQAWVNRRKKNSKIRNLKGCGPRPLHTYKAARAVHPTGSSQGEQDRPPQGTTPSTGPFPVAHHENQLVPTHLTRSVTSPARLPRFLVLSRDQPGERSTFFSESPAKIPTACSGCISDQLPFQLSPPTFETLRNDSLAATAAFPLLLNAYFCLSTERYGNYQKYTYTARHPHASARDTFTRRNRDWMGEQRAGDWSNYSESQAGSLGLASGATPR